MLNIIKFWILCNLIGWKLFKFLLKKKTLKKNEKNRKSKNFICRKRPEAFGWLV